MQESIKAAGSVSEKSSQKTGMKTLLLRALPFALFALTGIIAVAPFFSRTERAPATNEPVKMLWTDDMPNHIAYSKAFDKAFRSGYFYPRWLSDINKGYGVAMMIFYPPGLHYLSFSVHAVVGDWMDTYFVIAALGLAASGLSFYWLSRVFFGRAASAIASLFYMLFPFHIFNLYWQGAIPQFLGYVFMPLVVYFAYRLGNEGRLRYYAGLGFIYGLYLMTHFPISYLFTYTLALYAVLWAARERDVKIAFRIACAMALGLLISSIYWLPAALESKYVYEWASEVMPYHSTYLTLLESQNTFGFIVNASFTLIVAAIVLSVWALGATSLEGEPFVWKKKYTGDSAYFQVRLWAILAVTATFMSTTFSMHVSKLIPRIDAATPAWRWLAIATLFASLLVGAAAERLINGATRRSIRLWGMRAAIGVMIAISLWITVKYVIIEPVRTRQSYAFSPYHMDSGFTPKNSTPPDNLPDTPLVMLEPESGATEMLRWEPQYRELYVFAEEPSELRLKTYNFPGWVARVDGQPAPVSSDKDGAMVIAIPAGKHKVEAEFVNTPPRKMGIALASIGLMTIFGLALVDRLQWRQRRARPGAKAATVGDSVAERRDPKSSEAGFAATATGIRAATLFKYRYVIAGLAVALCLLLGFILLRPSNRGRASDAGRAAPSASQPETARGSALVTGAEVRLRIEGLDSIPVAVDEKGLDELINALSKKDGNAIDALTQAGRVINVARDTGVRVIQMTMGKARVRITEGEYIMQEGWVLERWLR